MKRLFFSLSFIFLTFFIGFFASAETFNFGEPNGTLVKTISPLFASSSDYLKIDSSFGNFQNGSIVSTTTGNFLLMQDDEIGYFSGWFYISEFTTEMLNIRLINQDDELDLYLRMGIGDNNDDFRITYYADNGSGDDIDFEDVLVENVWFYVSISVRENTFYVSYSQEENSFEQEVNKRSNTLEIDNVYIKPKYGTIPIYYDDFRILSSISNWDSVGVIELPDIGEVYTQTGSEDFNWIHDTYCNFDDEDCLIRFDYRYADIGSMVLLLEDTATSTTQYIDVIESLEDKKQLSDTLKPIIRSSEQKDIYQYFVSPDTGSSTLYQYAYVHWIATSSDIENAGFIIKYLKNVFPLSIFFQIKQIIDFNIAQENVYDPVDLDFSTLVHEEGRSELGSGTTTLLSANLLNDNLPLWQDKFYPLMQYFIWLMTLLLVFLRVRSAIGGRTEEI